MKHGYESLTWVNDKDGKEYVCSINQPAGGRTFEQLTEEERKRCSDVNVIVGNERW